jgi:hypothetical protein
MLFLRKLITILLLTGTGLFSHAGAANKEDSLICLEVEGKVLNADDNNTICTVRLFLDDAVVDSVVLKGGKKKFKFELKKNQHYSIRVVKEGYQGKSVCVHTQIDEVNMDVYNFYFETTLISLEVLSATVAARDSGLPVAKIYFDPKKHCFYYSRVTAATMKKDLCVKT